MDYEDLIDDRAEEQQKKAHKKRKKELKANKAEWKDRGTIGEEEALKGRVKAHYKKVTKSLGIEAGAKEDKDLLKVHGKRDAPKSKSFLTPSRKPSYKRRKEIGKLDRWGRKAKGGTVKLKSGGPVVDTYSYE